MTISTPVRIVALCGLILALGAGAFMMLGLRHGSSSEPVVVHAPPATPTTAHGATPTTANTATPTTTHSATPTTTHEAAPATAQSAGPTSEHSAAPAGTRAAPVGTESSSHAGTSTAKHTAAARVDATLPAALRHVLARHKLAVAIVYAPGFPGEAQAVSAARAGARQAHTGFAVLDIRDERTAVAVAERFPGVSDPAVLIVQRSGTVAFELDGVQETTTIAQAALQAKR